MSYIFKNHTTNPKTCPITVCFENRPLIIKYIFLIFFSLKFVYSANDIVSRKDRFSVINPSTVMESLIYIDESLQKESNEYEKLTRMQYNVMLSRLYWYILDLKRNIDNQENFNKNYTVILKTSNSEIVCLNRKASLEDYLEAFIESECLNVFLEITDLSYFDGLKNKVKKLQQNELFELYLEKLCSCKKIYSENVEILTAIEKSYTETLEFIEIRQDNAPILKAIIKWFFKAIKNAKDEYDTNSETQNKEAFIRKYKQICDTFKKKIQYSKSLICNQNNKFNDTFFRPPLMNQKKQTFSSFFELKNILMNESFYDDFFLKPQIIKKSLIELKQKLHNDYILLTDKNEIVQQMNLLKEYYKSIFNMYERKIDQGFTLFKQDLNDKQSTEINENNKDFKGEIFSDFTKIILDDLNSFFLFKIVAESYMENFKNYQNKKINEEFVDSIKSLKNSEKMEINSEEKDLIIFEANDPNDSKKNKGLFERRKFIKPQIQSFSQNDQIENADSSDNSNAESVQTEILSISDDSISESSQKANSDSSDDDDVESNQTDISIISENSESLPEFKKENERIINSPESFMNNQIMSDYFYKIADLDEMFKEFIEQILKIEKSIFDWYILMLSENEFERNKLFKYFIKEYNNRKKMISESYVDFFKLDKTKYIKNNNEFLHFESMDDKTKNSLCDYYKGFAEESLNK